MQPSGMILLSTILGSAAASRHSSESNLAGRSRVGVTCGVPDGAVAMQDGAACVDAMGWKL